MTEFLDGEDFFARFAVEPEDFSVERDAQLQEVFDELPNLLNRSEIFADVTPKQNLRDIDAYPTYTKKHILANLETVPHAGMAVGVLKNPITVFRDFMVKEGKNEGTEIEYFFGVIKGKVNGKPKDVFVLATVQRNVLLKVMKSENDLELLEKINGLQIYKGFES